MFTKIQRTLIAICAASFAFSWCSAYIFTGGPVVDVVKKPFQLTQQYVLKESIVSQYGLAADGDSSKAAAENGLSKLLGKPTEVALSTVNTTDQPDPAYVAAQKELARKIGSEPSELTRYLAWADKRRVADAMLAAQLKTAIQQNGGKPLDWSTNVKVATQFQTLTNDRLALSMAEANTAAEVKAQQKTAMGDALMMQSEEEQRTDAEARLRRP